MLRTLATCALAFLLAAPIIGSVVGAAPLQSQPGGSGSSLQVVAGYGGAQVTVEEFFPKTIRVAEGTTVTWRQGSLREHTVTFLAGQPKPDPDISQPEEPAIRMKNPLAEYPTPPNGPYDGSTFINSGLMDQGETFTVTFAKAGSYPFVCLPRGHDAMTGVVEVVAAGSPGLTTQQQVDELIARETAEFQAQLDEIWSTRSRPLSLENPDGTTTWFVRNGTDYRDEQDRIRLSVRAFLPNPLTIKRGDTVVWHTDTRVPVHTVTFLPQNAPPTSRWSPRTLDGELVALELLNERGRFRGDPNTVGWPRIVEDPSINRFIRPTAIYDPGQLYSSGPLGDTGPTIGRAFSLTFDTPGSFSYFCVPHVEIGQIGQLIVLD
jgi:YD repeat-containing protein